MQGLIAYFLIKHLGTASKAKYYRLIAMVLNQSLAGFVFAPVYFFLGFHLAALLIFISLLVVCCVLLLIRLGWRSNSLFHLPAAVMYTVVLSLNVIQGGLMAPTTMWFITVPVLAVFANSIRSGIVWGLICTLTIVFFYAAPFWGITFMPSPLSDTEVQLLYALGMSGLMLYIFGFALANEVIKKRNLDEILKLAGEDTLTGLYTRRRFFQVMKPKIEAGPLSLAVLMIDIDRFKLTNDTYGHHTGDIILESFARLAGLSVSVDKVCSRFGGEEFVIVLPNITRKEAMTQAEQLRFDVAANDFYDQEMILKITISIGVDFHESIDSMKQFDQMLIRADAALYDAKKSGRNQVVVFGG